MSPMAATQENRSPRPTRVLLRVMLAALTAVLAINLYTGAPLLAIWAGSRVQNGTQLTMSTVAVVIGVLVVTVGLLVLALPRVEAAYRVLTDQPTPRPPAPPLGSMRQDSAHVE